MSHEDMTMEMKALQAAGWLLAVMKEKARFNADCSTSKCLVYVFAHSATGRVMLVEVPTTYDDHAAEVVAYETAFKLLLETQGHRKAAPEERKATVLVRRTETTASRRGLDTEG